MVAKKTKTTTKKKSVKTKPSETVAKIAKAVKKTPPSKKSSPLKSKTAPAKATVVTKKTKPSIKKATVKTVLETQAPSPPQVNALPREDALRPLMQELENRVLNGQQEILVRLGALEKKIPIDRQEKASKPRKSDATLHDPLEGGVDSIRRLLSEIMEARIESIATELVSLRSQAAAIPSGDSLLSALDRLLQELGVIAFTAKRLDYLDPLIHTVVAERTAADLPENRILETLQPGFRTSRGTVLAKACVAVSREV